LRNWVINRNPSSGIEDSDADKTADDSDSHMMTLMPTEWRIRSKNKDLDSRMHGNDRLVRSGKGEEQTLSSIYYLSTPQSWQRHNRNGRGAEVQRRRGAEGKKRNALYAERKE
jgi:hypothetical protein